MSHLNLKQIDLAFGDHLVVRQLSLSLEKGRIGCLLGPSGCGKTTVLRCIAGFERLAAGEIRLDGALVSTPAHTLAPERRRIGMVFQDYALFPHLSVADNVTFGLRGEDAATRRARVDELLALVGLADQGRKYPHEMSGGQQQRVALARALAPRPSLLLLDEPFSNLDVELRERLSYEVRDIIKATNTTAILVTHDQHEAMALSDRIVVMNKGRVEQIGAPDAVYGAPDTAFVANFLGKTNVLAATGDGRGHVVIEALSVPLAGAGSGAQRIAVRPERLGFAAEGAPGFAARITSRVFQGAHWLLTAESAAGPVTLIRHNDGTPVPGEGESVRLSFGPGDAALLSEGAGS